MSRHLKVLAALAVFAGLLTACLPTSTTPPIRAAVLYDWFCQVNGAPGCAWNQNGVTPYSVYTPSQGYYSSSDKATISRQIAAMQYGNLDAAFVSWWGQGSQEDSVMPNLFAGAAGTGFKLSTYYEPEGQGDPSVSQIQSDLAYIKQKYAGDQSYLYINGKPTIYVYASGTDGCGMATRWKQANATEGFYVTLKVFPGYKACADQPDAWHQYGPASAEDHQAGQSFSISPGFNKVTESGPRLTRNVSRWTQNVQDMVNSNEPLQLITTFNEWGEGTAVESATSWPSSSGYGQYLDVMHAVIPPRTTTTTTTTSSTSPSTTTTTSTSPTTTTTTSSTTTTTTVPSTTTTTTSTSTTTTTGPQPTGHKVLVIPEENHSQAEALSSMPYLKSLGTTYGTATAYKALSHPSLPNYLGIFGGSLYGTSSDCGVGCGPTASTDRSVWDQTIAAGGTARAYQQSMASNCQTGGGSAYAPRHGPWPYWTNSTSRANCNANDVPAGTPTSGALLSDINAGHLPITGELTPDLNNDAHDGSLAQADAYLQSWIPKLMAGPDYTSGHLTIIVTFDEDDSSQGNLVQFVVVDPRLSGKVVSSAANHYSLTRWLEDNAGVSHQNNAASAADLKAAFGL